MPTYKELRELVLDALWSQWRELGVSATVRPRHSDDWIDPEPLVAFTAVHGDLDPRLRDESIDWVLRYGTYVSRARLKNVVEDWELAADHRFREYAATVNANGGVGWPAAGAKPLTVRPRARSLLEDLGRPSLISLRMRAIFGVGARAELIRAFLARQQVAMTAAELAVETSYRKRNVLQELEPLRFAGVVKSFRVVNADRFSLTAVDRVTQFVGPLPSRFTRWTSSFGALNKLLELAEARDKRSDLENAIAAVGLLEEHANVFEAAGMYPPQLPSGVAAWPAFLEWAVSQARAIARA